mmetsp:Transcript_3339/g.14025  ORF Transcript_3339/g.14025 Transcript_3339/m.14025 type:complete len:221 (-) Transcript_3339:1449-2111(-)
MSVRHFANAPPVSAPEGWSRPKGCDDAPASAATACNLSPSVSTSTSAGRHAWNASRNAGRCVSRQTAATVVICDAGCMSGCQYAPAGHTARSSDARSAPRSFRAAEAAAVKVACILASVESVARACAGSSSRSWCQPLFGAKSSSTSANADSIGSSALGLSSARKHRGTRTFAAASAEVTSEHARKAASTPADLTSRAIFMGCVTAFVRAYSKSPSLTRL